MEYNISLVDPLVVFFVHRGANPSSVSIRYFVSPAFSVVKYYLKCFGASKQHWLGAFLMQHQTMVDS